MFTRNFSFLQTLFNAGDADHKPFISGEADTASVPLDGSEDFLILACDGFWDVFSETDVVKLVRSETFVLKCNKKARDGV